MTNKSLTLSIIASAVLSSVITALAVSALQQGPPATATTANFNTLTQRIGQLEQQLGEMQRLNDSRSPAGVVTPQDQAPRAVAAAILQNQGDANNDIEQEAQVTQQPQQSLSERRRQRINEWYARQAPDYRKGALVEAGFEPEQAQRILQLESQAELDQLNSQYQARRARAERLQESGEADFSINNPIRDELGESAYERYLEANGLPTSAQIGSVIGGSPGDNAGLKAGDKIVSYAGQRVFSLRDVNNLTIQGAAGESVLVEVLRNDEPVQITIPRGPIGVNNGRRGFP